MCSHTFTMIQHTLYALILYLCDSTIKKARVSEEDDPTNIIINQESRENNRPPTPNQPTTRYRIYDEQLTVYSFHQYYNNWRQNPTVLPVWVNPTNHYTLLFLQWTEHTNNSTLASRRQLCIECSVVHIRFLNQSNISWNTFVDSLCINDTLRIRYMCKEASDSEVLQDIYEAYQQCENCHNINLISNVDCASLCDLCPNESNDYDEYACPNTINEAILFRLNNPNIPF